VKKIFIGVLIVLWIICDVILIMKYFFPVQFVNVAKMSTAFVLNLTRVNEKSIEKLERYGIGLDFPKHKWVYSFHDFNDSFSAEVLSEISYKYDCMENDICCMDSLSIDIFKKKSDFIKVKKLWESECKDKNFKKIDVNGKKYLMLCVTSDEKISSMHLIPENENMIFTYFFPESCGLDFKRLKYVLSKVKFKNQKRD